MRIVNDEMSDSPSRGASHKQEIGCLYVVEFVLDGKGAETFAEEFGQNLCLSNGGVVERGVECGNDESE